MYNCGLQIHLWDMTMSHISEFLVSVIMLRYEDLNCEGSFRKEEQLYL